MSDEKRTGLENITWLGYERKSGAPGIRNRILVIYTVKCSEFVARRIVERSGHTDVELIGFDGCTDNQYAVDLVHPYRLVFEKVEDQIQIVSITEIIDYH